jgi:2-aminobenzoate-CoA ligase
LGGLLLFPLRFGASTVLLDRFTPEAMIDSIRTNKVTIAFCAPISLRNDDEALTGTKRRVFVVAIDDQCW